MLYQADGNHNYAKAMMRCLHKQRLSGTPRFDIEPLKGR
jgi:hypothetical protein